MKPPAAEDLALDALADALAPRLYERIKKLAAAEREAGAEDAEILEYLESRGFRPER